MTNLYQLPDDLPVPVDDGACDHLEGMLLPSLLLGTSSGNSLDLSEVKSVIVIFFYPMIGSPDSPPMEDWNEIPGARGCTPQTCSYRDAYQQLTELDAEVIGTSSQSIEEQSEAAVRLKLPFELLNDTAFKLTESLNLPTFEYQGVKMIKRLTLVVVDGVIRKVFYPVFPPNENVNHVISWLNEETH
jgi:peroxiredoxin